MFPHNNNPLFLAKEAQQMASKAEGKDARLFQKFAMISMGVMAAAGASQVLLQLLREMNKKDDHARHR
jgi:hypothetical protein